MGICKYAIQARTDAERLQSPYKCGVLYECRYDLFRENGGAFCPRFVIGENMRKQSAKEKRMVDTFALHRMEITAGILPEACTICPFWAVDTYTLEKSVCMINGTEINLDGGQDEGRMKDSPIKRSKNYKKKNRKGRRKRS